MQTNFKNLFERWGSDKGILGYGYVYDTFLKDLEYPQILELGVWEGASIRAWREAFPDSVIVGVDIEERATYKHLRSIADIRIGDASLSSFLDSIVWEYGSFDVIIDDCSHVWEQQQKSFEYLWPNVSYKGLYIIEDLGTSYQFNFASNTKTTIEYLTDLVPKVIWPPNGPTDIKSIHFYQNICVLQKKDKDEYINY